MEYIADPQKPIISSVVCDLLKIHPCPQKKQDVYEEVIFQICNNLQLRSCTIPNDTNLFIEPFFVNGDADPFRYFYLSLGKVMIVWRKQQQELKYDAIARTFMTLSEAMIDFSEKLTCCNSCIAVDEGSTNKNDFPTNADPATTASIKKTIEQIIESIRLSQQQHLQNNNVEELCKSLHALIYEHLLDPFLFENTSWNRNIDFVDNSILKQCATYLEMGAASLTEVSILSSTNISVVCNGFPAPIDKWVIATSGGRVDIAGVFSDLPPIFFEHGGSVVGLAVTVDGVKPISARCRRRRCRRSTSRYHDGGGIVLVAEARCLEQGTLLHKYETRIETLQDMVDYRDPNSGASLLKAALLCLGIVPLSAIHNADMLEDPIQPFLDKFFCKKEEHESCCIELVTTSLLPRGSGMGGSCLLGGCILAALCRCAGVNIVRVNALDQNGGTSTSITQSHIEVENLTHAVLALEQLTTSRGGWQDQTNLMGGFKIARSKVGIPEDIKIERLKFEQVKELNERLVLVYSGTARLAKNLLRSVLWRWSRKTKEIVATLNDLVSGAEKAAAAILSLSQEDNNDGVDAVIDQLGRLMLECREQKKTMVGDDSAEPAHVSELIEALQKVNAISGGVLLGAGGGGFLALVAAKGITGMELKAIAERQAQQMLIMCEEQPAENGSIIATISCARVILEDCTWHKCCVCVEDLQVGIIENSNTIDEDFAIDDFSLDWQKPGMVLL